MTLIGGKKTATGAPVEESPTAAADAEKKDPFEEIDFGSFFQDYLDPGYRSSREMEDIERPSFENFLSKPGSLTDHLVWQLGSISMRPEVREAVELIIGNLNEDGYLIASDEELLGIAPPAPPESDAAVVENVFKEAAALGISSYRGKFDRGFVRARFFRAQLTRIRFERNRFHRPCSVRNRLLSIRKRSQRFPRGLKLE